MWITFAVIALAIAFYATEVVSLELTSLAVLAVLLVLFSIYPLSDGAGGVRVDMTSLLSGFSDPALIAILSLLVIGQAIVQTGALDGPANRLVKLTRARPDRIVPITLGLVLLVSAVLNNTPIVVIFIPIVIAIAKQLVVSQSRLMIPLSYAAILGGNLTLIGSSTNLLAAGSYLDATGQSVGFFDFTLMGLVLAAVGLVYLVRVAPDLLTDRVPQEEADAQDGGRQFIVQVEVTKNGLLEGQTARAGLFPGLPNITVRSIYRQGRLMLPPYDAVSLQVGDLLMIAATRKALIDLLKKSPGLMPKGEGPSGEAMLAEVVVAPASRMVGRPLEQIAFTQQTGCTVIGIQRHSRMIRQPLNAIRLEAGDTLLVLGTRRDMKRLRANKDVLLLEWSASDLPKARQGRLVGGVFAVVVVTAATGLLPIPVAALAGAVALLAFGCLNIRQAARAIDRRVVLIVAAALAMGQALQATGGASFLTRLMMSGLEGTGPVMILSGFFLLVAFMTNVLSNYATAVLFTPIALTLADSLDADPFLFLTAVIFGANCSFATPMGYQTNLLVMAPGHYRFLDFLKAGTPLILLLWVTFTLMAWLYLLIMGG